MRMVETPEALAEEGAIVAALHAGHVSARGGSAKASRVAKETVELAFLVAIQFLPPMQRAVLILRGVLGWSAKETADLLDASVASVNSGLQRARATLQVHLPARRRDWAPGLDATEAERVLLQRYLDAAERGDVEAVACLLREDVRFSMPPEAGTWVGRDIVVKEFVDGGFGSASFGDLRCLTTRVNRMPAVACYVRKAGDSEHRPLALDVLAIEDGQIAEITTFSLAPLLEALGLPPTL